MPVAPSHTLALTEGKSLFKRVKAAGEHSVVQGAVSVDKLGRKWNSALHPRDARGRFIETGGIAKVTVSGRVGRVLRALGGNPAKVLMQWKDGTRGEEYATRLTMIRRPDGSLPTSSKKRVLHEDDAREKMPQRGNGLEHEDFGHHNDRDGDGIPDAIDPEPGIRADHAPGGKPTVKAVKDRWAAGDITESLDGPEVHPLEKSMAKHKAEHLTSAQLSPRGSFIVGKLDNDPNGHWLVYHSNTAGLVAGSEESRLRTKKEALALARQLEDMDVHGEPFDWNSPGVYDRMERDEEGFHEALAQARDKAAAELAAAKPTGPRQPVKPNATRPDGTPNAPAAPKAPDLPPAPDNPRDAGYQDAERAWAVAKGDRAKAEEQAGRWTSQAYNDDIRGLADSAERRTAAAERLRELAGDQKPTPTPHGGENGAQAPEGALREPVRPHRAEVLGDVPAEQGRSDSARAEGDVLHGDGRAGGVGDRDADTGTRAVSGRDGLPEHGRGAGQGEEAGRGDGARGERVPAARAGDGGPRDGGRPAARGDQGRVAPKPDAEEAPARRFQPKGQGDLAPSTQKARVEANIEALKTLRALEAGDRPATEEEQRKLARWSGWGAIPDAVDYVDKKSRYVTPAQRAEIAELLGEDGLKAARGNTKNAHYTDAAMVDAIWKAVEGLGFDGGVVLEPGAGSGNFIGHAPSNAHMIGVELDPVTAGIAHYLYPDASIRRESFGATRMPEGSVDAVVGNVPFGKYPVSDPRYNAKQQFQIHNHFIIKSLALTKPGGVVALITSRYTMDAEDDKARREMAKYGDLVTAVRLPGGAHKKAAGTDVITDLLVFRRRADDQEPGGDQSWIESSKADINGYEIPVNNYFQANPGQVLGELGTGRGQFSDHDLTVKGKGELDKELPKALARAVQEGRPRNPNDGVRAPEDKRSLKERLASLLEAGSARGEGNIAVKDGKFTVVEDGAVVEHKVPKSQADELQRLVTMRDLASSLLSEESQHEQDTPRIQQLRKALNDAYDEYVREHGALNRFTWTTRKNPRTGEETQSRLNPQQGAFRKDPSSALVYALEKYDPETGRATKASIMSERVVAPRKPVEHADRPDEALSVVLDTHGYPHLDEIARLLGTDKKTARERLGRLVYDDPENPDRLITASEYQSGNVRTKLAVAREKAADNPRFQANVDALEQVLPKDLLPGEIDGRLGAAWIGHEDVQQFLQEITGDRWAKVKHPGGSLWDVEGGNHGVASTSQFGTDRMPAGKLMQKLLQQKPIEVWDTIGKDANGRDIRKLNADATEAAQAKASEMQERFSEWLWEDPQRAERLAKVYNEKFNSLVMRQGDSRERAMPGLASWFKPKVHGHQYAAVDRIVNEPTALLDHVVGAGKTAEMVMGTQELRRLGLVKKPAIVIPNHMLEQFTREYLQLYPQAKILAAGSDDLTGDKRRRFIARAATGDWDAVILTQKAFESIPMSGDAIQRYVDNETEKLRKARERAAADATSKKDSTLKQTETRLANREAKLEKLVARTKDMDSGLSFEQTGIDYLMVDEAHHFKNLSTPSSGAGAIDGSGRSTDLDSKLHYLREKAGDRGRVATFATGTPIANSVAEQYVMTKYLRPDLLDNAGIEDFDQWVGTFGEMVTDVEITNDGSGFKTKTRLAKFRNVPELLRMWGTFTDTKTADDLKLPTPDLIGGRPEMVESEPTDAQRAAIAAIQLRMEGAKGGQFLRLFGMGRRAAQDLRLIKPEELEELASTEGLDEEDAHALHNLDLNDEGYGSKLRSVADRVAGIWEQNKDNVYVDPDTKQEQPLRGGHQIVFMDQGTPQDGPNSGNWNAYQELKDQLVERGIPAEKVRFVHDAKNDKQKAELFAAARDGRVAVLIGSTEKMGVGTNVQQRAVALHHVDIPWRPADVEQREGRILRQGNQNSDARILRYVTQRSFDAYSWQTIERKGRFISQVKRGKIDVREMEDIGDAVGSFAVAKASATGDPRIMEHAQVGEEVKRLSRLSRSHEKGLGTLRQKKKTAEENIKAAEQRIAQHERLLPLRKDISGDAFTLTVGAQAFTDRKDAGTALRDTLVSHLTRYVPSGITEDRPLGRFAGFDVAYHTVNKSGGKPMVVVTFPDFPSSAVFSIGRDELMGSSGAGLVTRLENKVTGLDKELSRDKGAIPGYQKEIAAAEVELAKPFKQADQLTEAKKRLGALDELFTAKAAAAQSGDEEVAQKLRRAEAAVEDLDRAAGIDKQAEAEAAAFPDPAPIKRDADAVVPPRKTRPKAQPPAEKPTRERAPSERRRTTGQAEPSEGGDQVTLDQNQVAQDLESIGGQAPETPAPVETPEQPQAETPSEPDQVTLDPEQVQHDIAGISDEHEQTPHAPEAGTPSEPEQVTVEPEQIQQDLASIAPEQQPQAPEAATTSTETRADGHEQTRIDGGERDLTTDDHFLQAQDEPAPKKPAAGEPGEGQDAMFSMQREKPREKPGPAKPTGNMEEGLLAPENAPEPTAENAPSEPEQPQAPEASENVPDEQPDGMPADIPAAEQAPETPARSELDDVTRDGFVREPSGPYQGPWEPQTYRTGKVGLAEAMNVAETAPGDPGFEVRKGSIVVHDPNRARFELDGAYHVALDNVADPSMRPAERQVYARKRDAVKKLLDAIAADRQRLHDEAQQAKPEEKPTAEAEKLQGAPPADVVTGDMQQVREEVAKLGADAPDAPTAPDEPDAQTTDAPETEPEQAVPPLPQAGDLGEGLSFENADHGLVLDGNTFNNKEIIKSVGGFRFAEVPGGGKDKYGKPVRKWTATGTDEERAAALARLADALGVPRPGAAGPDVPEQEEKYPPTPEQQDVIDAVKSGKDTVVRALAGTGKTSTLEMIARRLRKDDPKKRIAYVAFNRSVRIEAQRRMPGNVESRTGDSIAYDTLTDGLKAKYQKQKNAKGGPDAGLRRNDEVAKLLGITRPVRVGDQEFSTEELANAAIKTVENYSISADDEIGAQHVPVAYGPVADQIIEHAGKAWADLKSPKGQLRFTNSHATKMWALKRPDLSEAGSGLKRPAHVIFFDEAQDINPVMAKVIADQHIQKVYVGDSNQAIYGFRGAVDELDNVQAEHDLPLTKSWRFGPQVADIGNRFLQLVGSTHRVEGGGGPSTVHPADTMDNPDAILVRSNAGAIGEILTAQNVGRLVGVPDGTKAELRKLVNTAAWLKGERGMPDQVHDDLAAFRNWAEVKKAAEKGDDAKVTMLARIVDAHGTDSLRNLVDQLIDAGDENDKRKPDVVVTTAHKSKGLEWDRVKIGPDFRGPKTDPDTGNVEMPSDEEHRLAYVAVTRARKELDPGSLSWVYSHTDPNGGKPGEKDRTPEEAPATPEAPSVEPEQVRPGDTVQGDEASKPDTTPRLEEREVPDDSVGPDEDLGEFDGEEDRAPLTGEERDAEQALHAYARQVSERMHAPTASVAPAAHITDDHDRRMAQHQWETDHPLEQYDTALAWALDQIKDPATRDIAARRGAELRAELDQIGEEARRDYLDRMDNAATPEERAAAYYGPKKKNGQRGGRGGIQTDDTYTAEVLAKFEDAVAQARQDAEAAGGDPDAAAAALEEAVGWHGELATFNETRDGHLHAYIPDGYQPVSSAQAEAFYRMEDLNGEFDSIARRDHYRLLLTGEDVPFGDPHKIVRTGDGNRDRMTADREWLIRRAPKGWDVYKRVPKGEDAGEDGHHHEGRDYRKLGNVPTVAAAQKKFIDAPEPEHREEPNEPILDVTPEQAPEPERLPEPTPEPEQAPEEPAAPEEHPTEEEPAAPEGEPVTIDPQEVRDQLADLGGEPATPAEMDTTPTDAPEAEAPKTPEGPQHVKPGDRRRVPDGAEMVDAHELTVGDHVYGKRQDGTYGTVEVESVRREPKHTLVIGRDENGRRTTMRMRAEDAAPRTHHAGGENALDWHLPDSGEPGAVDPGDLRVGDVFEGRAAIGAKRGPWDKATRKLRVIGEPRKRGAMHDVWVEDTRTGERGHASLPNARPVNVLERGPERHRDEQDNEQQNEQRDEQGGRRDVPNGNAPSNGPDGAPGVPGGPNLPGEPNRPNRDSNNDGGDSNNDDRGGRRILPSVRKLNNRPGPNHGIPGNGGGPNGVPGGLPHPHLPGGHGNRGRKPGTGTGRAAGHVPAESGAEHGHINGEHGGPLTDQPSEFQPHTDLPTSGPAHDGSVGAPGAGAAATEGGTAVPVSTVNPEAPASQEVMPGWTREHLDQASWDDLADLVGQAEGGHLDNLMAYMDDRQAAEDLAAGRDVTPPSNAPGSAPGSADVTPDAGVSAGQGGSDIGPNNISGDVTPVEGGHLPPFEAYQQAGHSQDSKGWPAKTRAQLTAEVADLNHAVLENLVRSNPNPQSRIDDAGVFTGMLSKTAATNLLKGRQISLRAFLDTGAPTVDGRKKVNPLLTEEDTHHFFDMTPTELAAAARSGGTWSLPGAQSYDGYVAAYDASRNPNLVDASHLAGEASHEGAPGVAREAGAVVHGAEAGAAHAGAVVAPPAGAVDAVAQGQAERSAQDAARAELAQTVRARGEAFDHAGPDGFADVPVDQVRAGDLIRGGNGKGQRAVLSVVTDRAGDGSAGGEMGTSLLVRHGDHVVPEFYPHGPAEEAPRLQVSASVGRALDLATPHASAPREGRRVGAGGRYIPAGDPSQIGLGGGGRLTDGQLIDLAQAAKPGFRVQVDTPQGSVAGALRRVDVGAGLTVDGPHGTRTITPSDIHGVRVLSGIVDVRGDTAPVSDLASGSRVALTDGKRDVVGQLVRDEHGPAVLDDGGRRFPIGEGAQVAPVYGYGDAGRPQGNGSAPGVWTQSPSGAVTATAPGEWSAAIIPQGSDGVAWRVSGAPGTHSGRAGSVGEAKAQIGKLVGDAADARKTQFLPRDDQAPNTPAEAPPAVGGQSAEWTPVTSLVIGDRARVDGWAAGRRQSYAGHVVGVTPVSVDRHDGRIEPMLAVTVAENSDGQSGWRGVIVSPLDSLAARVPDVADSDQVSAESTMDVLAGRLPEQIPQDSEGNALFPGSIVRELGDGGRTGIVTQARRADVSVQWGGGKEEDVTGAAVQVTATGAARPAGWTRTGQRVQPGMTVQFGARSTRNHAGATVRAGGRDGTVESVDGDSALVSTSDGQLVPVNVPDLTITGRAAPDRPDQAPTGPVAVLDKAPASDLEHGDVVVLADDAGDPLPVVVDDVRADGDQMVLDVTDARDGTPGQVTVNRDDAVDVALTSTGEPAQVGGSGDAPQFVIDPGQLPEPTGPTAQPIGGYFQRQAVKDLGLDLDGVSDPTVAVAAARIRAGAPLTAEESTALADAVRAAASADGTDPAKARELNRAADSLDRAAERLTGRQVASGPAPDLGAGPATLSEPHEFATGDMVAFPSSSGPMTVGRVRGARPVGDGSLWVVEYDTDGRTERQTVSAGAKLWRLPDLADPTPVQEPPARSMPDASPARPVVTPQQQAADAVAVNAAQAALGAGSLNELRDQVANAVTADEIDRVAKDADPATRDAVRESVLQTVNESEALPGESPEQTAARIAGLLLNAPAAIRSGQQAQAAQQAAEQAQAATAQRVTPQPAPIRIAADAKAGRVDASADEIVKAVLKVAGVRASQVTPGTLEELVQLADEVVAAGQQDAVRRILAGVAPKPGAATRLTAAFKAVRGKLTGLLRSNLQRGPVRSALRAFSDTVRKDGLGWEETQKLRDLMDVFDVPEADRPFAAGEPADFLSRVDHWRGMLPGSGGFGRTQVRGRWFNPLRRSDLAGEVRAVDGTRTVLDRAADGGPGETALAHTDAVRGLGRAVSDEVTSRVAKALPDLGGDPRQAVQAARTRLADAEQRWRDAVTSGDRNTAQVRAELDQARTDAEQTQRRVSTQVAREAAQVLTEIRSMGERDGVAVPVAGGGPEAAALRWAAQFLPTDWLAALNGRQLAVRAGERGGYSRDRLTLGSLEELVDGAGPLGRSALHELWHALEEALPDLRAAEWAYHWHRTSTGDVGARRRDGRNSQRRLADVLPGRGHSLGEMTREDGFTDPYVGREYAGEEKWEIGAMPFESLFGGSPYLDEDLEHWLLGLLAHVGGQG